MGKGYKGSVFVSVMLSCLFIAALWSAYLLALLFVMFSCVFVSFPRGVLGQVWYLIVLIFTFFLILIFVHFELAISGGDL